MTRRPRRSAPPGARVAVLVPAALAVLPFTSVIFVAPVLAVMLGSLLLAAAATAVVLRASRSLAEALVATVGAALLAGVLGGMLAVPVGEPRLVVSAAAAAVTGGAVQILAGSRVPAAAVVPPVLLLSMALVMGASTRPGMLILAAAVVAAAALVLLVAGPWNGGPDGPASNASPTRSGVVLATVGALLAGGVAFGAGTASVGRLDPPLRLGGAPELKGPVAPPALRDVDPLTQVTRWQTYEKTDDRLLVRVFGPVPATRLVWLALSRYDGVTWGVPLYYADNGPRFEPLPDTVGKPSASTITRFEVGPGLPGPWVPQTTQPVQLIGDRVAADEGAGAVVASVLPIGRRFEVRSTQVRTTVPALTEAGPGPSRASSPEVALPAPLPKTLQALVDRAERVGDSPFLRMRRLAELLRSPRFSASSGDLVAGLEPGRTYGDIEAVLIRGVGLQEQYAAAFALGARSWGIPTRLAAGWLVEPSNQAAVDVTASAAEVWVQARLDGVGWVSFQPTPQDRDAGRAAVVLPPRPSNRPSPSPTATTATPTPTPTATQRPDDVDQGRGLLGALVPLLPVLLGVLLWVVAVGALRRRRRAGLAGGDPAASAAGAWEWARTLLIEAGLPLPASASPDRAAAGELDDDLPPGLGALVARVAAPVVPVVFGPGDPGPGPAQAAWAAVGELDEALGSRGGPALRLRRLLLVPRRPHHAGAGRHDFSRTGAR